MCGVCVCGWGCVFVSASRDVSSRSAGATSAVASTFSLTDSLCGQGIEGALG